MTVLQPLVAGAALFAIGIFASAYRREPAALLRGILLMGAGAAVAAGGASRLASASFDPLSGQGFAVLVALGSLALAALGVGVFTRGTSR